MADSIFELLAPHIDESRTQLQTRLPLSADATTRAYIARLTTLHLQALTESEAESIRQTSQSTLRSLQDLSRRSYRSIIAASDHLGGLSEQLPRLGSHSRELDSALPDADSAARQFAAKYDRSQESSLLDRRRRYMQLNHNIDRIANILELPALLSSIVSSSSTAASASQTSGVSTMGYASALDIHAQVKRLATLYPSSQLVQGISKQAGEEIRNLASLLIGSLDSPGLKLAAAMRAVGWLRRVSPDLVKYEQATEGHAGASPESPALSDGFDGSDESLGALFLVRRLGTLRRTIDALDPLKELADADASRAKAAAPASDGPSGTQSERYIKRYIEIFREHSFAIISTHKSIFTPDLPAFTDEGKNGPITAKEAKAGPHASPDGSLAGRVERQQDVLAIFIPFLSEMLFDMLRAYLPNVTDRPARESLLTQLLYCAASLGRLGADFSMMLALMGSELSGVPGDAAGAEREQEWVQVQKKHRAQASRLEMLAGVHSVAVNDGDSKK